MHNSSRATPTSIRGSTLTLAAAAALFAVSALPGTAVAQAERARATLVQIDVQGVPALGLSAYTGRYGSAVSTATGEDPGSFADPDGVLGRLTIATKVNRTASADSKNYAQSHLTALDVPYHGKSLLSVASLDSYAECVPAPIGPWALAYNRTDSGLITVLGQRVANGTTELTVSGADLGQPDVATGKLTVTVTPHQDPAEQARQSFARAWLDIAISGVIEDEDGRTVHQGPITSLRLGEVEANCGDVPPTTTTTPAPTTDVPTTKPSTGTTTSTTTTQPSTPGSSTSVTTSPGAVPGGSDRATKPLAETGVSGLWWQGLTALTLLASGVVGVLIARRKRSA